ncbi:MAG: hypothetical protein JO033_14810 [Acidobacteriaceae bacterium]|nr:hypothetical protein [Acidobacteriaceae bacterium]MBV9498961.1 hypothetical protein [Acidobacteriaceae bacterium]
MLGRAAPCFRAFAAILAILASSAAVGRADDSADARAQVSAVSTALAGGSPADAMTAFDRSFPKYEILKSYFEALVSAFRITSEIDVNDEDDAPTQIKVNVHWALTLQDLETNYTENRAADIDVQLVKQSGKWKITGFAPIDIFNPQQHRRR